MDDLVFPSLAFKEQVHIPQAPGKSSHLVSFLRL